MVISQKRLPWHKLSSSRDKLRYWYNRQVFMQQKGSIFRHSRPSPQRTSKTNQECQKTAILLLYNITSTFSSMNSRFFFPTSITASTIFYTKQEKSSSQWNTSQVHVPNLRVVIPKRAKKFMCSQTPIARTIIVESHKNLLALHRRPP